METENNIREEIEEQVGDPAPETAGGPAPEPMEAPEPEPRDHYIPPKAVADSWQAEEESAKQEKKTFLRACGGWTDILPIAAVLSVLLSLFGSLLSLALDNHLLPVRDWGMKLLGDLDSVEFLLQYFEFFGIWIVFLIVALIFKSNWPMLKAFFYNGHGNNLKSIFIGILLGFGMNGFCVLMSCIMGDIKLSFNEFRPLTFFVFLFCVWIQSGAEEITDRCYFYQKLRRRYRWPAIAILGNSVVFMAMHMGNPGVTTWGLLQVFLIGVLFSLIVYFWDSLWTVIWAHTAWNFSQSIVFGLPNSGIVSKYSVFKLEAASARDGIFYNTSFGVEGSIGANAMIGAFIVIILVYGLVTKRGEKVDYWQEMEARDAGKKHIWEAVILTVIMLSALATGLYIRKWADEHAAEIQQIQQIIEEQQAAEQAGEAPVEAPAVETPALEQPATETPAVETPAVETPAAEQPAAETPAQGTPAGEQPATETPAAEVTPAPAQPAGQEPAAETPAVQEQPAAEQLPEQGSPIL